MDTALYNKMIQFSESLKGGVLMDVINPEQAKIAEDAGAVAVMALERVPSDIRKSGGVARASDPEMIEKIQQTVKIPVMAKCRIGHIIEARILEAMNIDCIDESEVLTPADEEHHIDKWNFKVPFVCGCTDLSEALRRIAEGATLLRTKGEAGTANIVEAVRHLRHVRREIAILAALPEDELMTAAKNMAAPYHLVKEVHKNAKLPVPNFAAGGVATPADAALCMLLGAEAVFVGSAIFKSENPAKRAKAIVEATKHYNDYGKLVEISKGLGIAMQGLDLNQLQESEKMAPRVP